MLLSLLLVGLVGYAVFFTYVVYKEMNNKQYQTKNYENHYQEQV